MKITTMKDEKMSHNNPAFRNSTVTLGMPQEPRESYLSSNEFISKSHEVDKNLSWFAQFYWSFPREIWTNLVSFFLSQTTSNRFGFFFGRVNYVLSFFLILITYRSVYSVPISLLSFIFIRLAWLDFVSVNSQLFTVVHTHFMDWI